MDRQPGRQTHGQRQLERPEQKEDDTVCRRADELPRQRKLRSASTCKVSTTIAASCQSLFVG